jgi:hypothetical protein
MRVQPLQLNAGVAGGELPIGLGVVFVSADLLGGDFLGQGWLVGDAPIETLAGQHADFRFSQIQPTAVLGRVMPFEPFDEAASHGGGERLIKRGSFVGAEVVLHENDLAGLGKVSVGQFLEHVGIAHSGVAVCNLNVAPALQWSEHHEQVGRAVALVLVIKAHSSPWFRCDRHPRFGDQLLRCLVQANHGERRIVRPLINLQHVFHAGYEGGIGIRRNDPSLLEVTLERIFFGS